MDENIQGEQKGACFRGSATARRDRCKAREITFRPWPFQCQLQQTALGSFALAENIRPPPIALVTALGVGDLLFTN